MPETLARAGIERDQTVGEQVGADAIGTAASIFFVDPKEKLLTVYMIQKRRGIAISREYKRMVYQTIVQEEK